MSFDLRHYWPPLATQLLLKAALHRDAAVARQAWHQWETQYEFEQAYWSDVLIASMAGRRLGEIGVDTPLAPRLAGLRRYIWSSGQTKIIAAGPLLQMLHANGVPVMLLNGAARIAADPRALSLRFLPHLDVLVAFAAWPKAVEIFDHEFANVWHPDRETTAGQKHENRHSITALANPKFQMHLHRFSLLLNRQPCGDDGLWRRARPGVLAGVPLQLPHPCDLLALTLGNAFLHAPIVSCDWPADTIACIEAPEFDWTLFRNIVLARELSVPVAAGLTFMRDEIGVAVPDDILSRFADEVREPFVAEFTAYAAGYRIGAEEQGHAVST